MKEISVVDFDHKDVVRHPLVSKIVKAYSDQKLIDDQSQCNFGLSQMENKNKNPKNILKKVTNTFKNIFF